MSWTQPLCDACWAKENPGRAPVRCTGDPAFRETCCECGQPTDGIYVRRDPREEEVDE